MTVIIAFTLMITAIVGTYLWCLHSENSNCASEFHKTEDL